MFTDQKIEEANQLKMLTLRITPFVFEQGQQEQTETFSKGGAHHLRAITTSFDSLNSPIIASVYFFDGKDYVTKAKLELWATSGFQQAPVTALSNKVVKPSEFYVTFPADSVVQIRLSRTLEAGENLSFALHGHQENEVY